MSRYNCHFIIGQYSRECAKHAVMPINDQFSLIQFTHLPVGLQKQDVKKQPYGQCGL